MENETKSIKTLNFKIFGLEREEIGKILTESGTASKFSVDFSTEFLDTRLSFFFPSENFTPETNNSVLTEVYNLFGEKVYAEENISLAKLVIEILRLRESTLSVAESLTGGLICHRIVQIAGASAVFTEGAVTYSNKAKTERLGVPEETLNRFGAVSEEVSRAMCRGLVDVRSDYAVSTTGIAGPGGGGLTKPVGLCYISVGNKDSVLTKKFIFGGDREEVREKAANTALFMMIKFAKSH